ncbi:hypothetical protein PINS_up023775 [Pythium insidiosum]|nr:hypothetical protein PINS_up023775 [Pythium insidiosum]
MPSPLAISNIILSQSEHGGGGADATDGPKLASFRHALQPNPVPVLLHVRRVRVALGTLSLSAAITAVTYVLARDEGLTLLTTTTATSSSVESLAQDYTAALAMVLALLVKPLSMLVAMVLPLALWLFATPTVMPMAQRSWRLRVAVLGASFLLLWLLSNAFFAANVRLRPVADGSNALNSTALAAAAQDDNNSSLRDSVLRSLVSGRQPRARRSRCTAPSSRPLVAGVEFGIASRDWMRTVELPTVATPDQVQQQQQQQQQQLPFSVETAGALTTYGLSFVRGLFERPRANGSAADSAANADATSFSSVGSLHRHARETLSQLVARADALQETTSPLARWLNASGVTLTFQRDALSDSVVFESVTLQLPLRSEYLQRRLSLSGDATASVAYDHTIGSDWFLDINVKDECGDRACLVSPRGLGATAAPVEDGAQVRAAAICRSSDASSAEEDVVATAAWDATKCRQRSTTSLLVMSVAERVTAEASNRTGDLLRLKNARKTYSVTVGRLRWNATQGAVVVLPVTTRERRDQALVVPVASIPMEELELEADTAQSSSSSGVSELPVLVSTTTREIDGSSGALRGDLVWPRNVGADRDAVADGPQCVAERGRFLSTIERNHWFSEQSLPTAVHAALLWVFQRGDVQSWPAAASQSAVIGGGSHGGAVDVVVQVPPVSALLTYVGCALLSLLSVIVLLFGRANESRVERFLEPYHLAQLLVNRDASSAFMPPSFVLQADLLHLSGELLSRSAPPQRV